MPPSLYESPAVPGVGDAAVQQEVRHQANQDRHRRQKEKRLREIHEENTTRVANGVPQHRDGPVPTTGAAKLRREQKAKAKAKAIANSGAFAVAKAKSVAKY